jgi:RES domain-containing protein
MLVYRLGLTIYAEQLTGEGARLFGGRWNEVGTPCLYTCETKALCVLEYSANVARIDMPLHLSFTTYQIPDEGWQSFSAHELPSGWQAVPATQAVRRWGTEQLKNALAIRVPSVIIPTEFNFALNPLHADFKKVKIKAVEPFTFDLRIKQ